MHWKRSMPCNHINRIRPAAEDGKSEATLRGTRDGPNRAALSSLFAKLQGIRTFCVHLLIRQRLTQSFDPLNPTALIKFRIYKRKLLGAKPDVPTFNKKGSKGARTIPWFTNSKIFLTGDRRVGETQPTLVTAQSATSGPSPGAGEEGHLHKCRNASVVRKTASLRQNKISQEVKKAFNTSSHLRSRKIHVRWSPARRRVRRLFRSIPCLPHLSDDRRNPLSHLRIQEEKGQAGQTEKRKPPKKSLRKRSDSLLIRPSEDISYADILVEMSTEAEPRNTSRFDGSDVAYAKSSRPPERWSGVSLKLTLKNATSWKWLPYPHILSGLHILNKGSGMEGRSWISPYHLKGLPTGLSTGTFCEEYFPATILFKVFPEQANPDANSAPLPRRWNVSRLKGSSLRLICNRSSTFPILPLYYQRHPGDNTAAKEERQRDWETELRGPLTINGVASR
ncbi:hypothetical protein J6590_005533 [Homalodisca vitripennis]|nr:hypothetical protein J6590_005533 [Homalodisca vitripennis]